jgi:hypothetical protein
VHLSYNKTTNWCPNFSWRCSLFICHCQRYFRQARSGSTIRVHVQRLLAVTSASGKGKLVALYGTPRSLPLAYKSVTWRYTESIKSRTFYFYLLQLGQGLPYVLLLSDLLKTKAELNSVAWVRERNIPTERPPLVGKIIANFCGYRCRVVSAADPYGRILDFLDQSRYFFFQATPQLYSRDWVDTVLDPVLIRKSRSAGNRTGISGSVTRNSDH